MLDIENLRDRYSGERVFILGNGPSLADTPLEQLDSEYTIGMTQIGKLYTDNKWRPSFYYNPLGPDHGLSPSDQNIVLQNIENDTICFLSSKWSTVTHSDKNVFYFNPWSLSGSPFGDLTIEEVATRPVDYLLDFWSDNINFHIYHYHSMYGAIQLAAYLGFDKMYFIGCDLGMEYKNPHMIFESALDPFRYENGKHSYINDAYERGILAKSLINAIAMKSIQRYNNGKVVSTLFNSKRKDHFTSNYIDNVVIQDSVKHEQEIKKSHMAAKRICENNGIKMYNATNGGDLDIYDRVDLHRLLTRS